MSKKIPSRGDAVGGGSDRRLRSQTPLRRSPRFLPQENSDSRISEKTSSKKKPSAAKTHLESSPFSPDSKEIASTRKTPVDFSAEMRKKPSRTRLRSPPFSPDSNETTSTGKTPNGCFRESQKKCPRSNNTRKGPSASRVEASRHRRRSLPLACNVFEVMQEKSESVVPGSIDGSQSRRRSPRCASSPVEVVRKVSNLGVTEVVQKESDSALTGAVNVSQSRRRSPRFASNSAEVMKKNADSVLVEVLQKEDGSQVTGALKPSAGQRRSRRLTSSSTMGRKIEDDLGPAGMVAGTQIRRSPRLASALAAAKKEAISEVNFVEKMVEQPGSSNIEGKMEVGTSELEREMAYTETGGERKGSPTVVTKIEGAEKNGRKRGRSVELDIETERDRTDQCSVLDGWTREQEMALQRAYLSAKPSPHFWKKVSKMVPGKSDQECFNKIHANLPTPPQPKPRSRANRTNFSPLGSFSLSDSKSTKFTERNAKRQRSSKQKILVKQKTVRHLLRKHCLIDQSQEADHFSVLETSPFSLASEFPEIKSPATPDCTLKPSGFLQKCSERSSSAHKSAVSRFKEKQAKCPSPEVLKRIKNMALHEKYIDHLHCREARRKTGAKTANSVATQTKISSEMGTGVLKAARTALISEARDVISHFHHMQANPVGEHESCDTDDDDVNTDECDDDDE